MNFVETYRQMLKNNEPSVMFTLENYNIHIINSNKEKNFDFPYILVIPKKVNDTSTLVVDNRTPKASDLSFDKTIENTLIDNIRVSKLPIEISKRFNEPILIPIIPRFKGFYTTALGSYVRNNDMTKLKEYIKNGEVDLKESDLDKLKDIDKQYHNMIEDAKEYMRNTLNNKVNDKVIQTGYSAASKLASNYTELYPGDVEILITGGTTGLGIRPEKEFYYPLGVKDIENWGVELSRRVKRFTYIGNKDENDPALANCILDEKRDINGNLKPKINSDGSITPILDENQKYTSLNKDCYTDNEVDTIYRNFGSNILDRFKNYEETLRKKGYNICSKIYEGDHISVQKNENVTNDVIKFLYENKYKNKYTKEQLLKNKQKLFLEKQKRNQKDSNLKLTYGSKGFMNIILISIIIIMISIFIIYLIKIL